MFWHAWCSRRRRANNFLAGPTHHPSDFIFFPLAMEFFDCGWFCVWLCVVVRALAAMDHGSVTCFPHHALALTNYQEEDRLLLIDLYLRGLKVSVLYNKILTTIYCCFQKVSKFSRRGTDDDRPIGSSTHDSSTQDDRLPHTTRPGGLFGLLSIYYYTDFFIFT